MTARDKLVEHLFEFMRNQRVSCRERISLDECNNKCRDLYELWGCIPKRQAESLADELIKSGLVVDDTVYTQTYLGDIRSVLVYKCEKCGQKNYGKGLFCRVCGCKLKE